MYGDVANPSTLSTIVATDDIGLSTDNVISFTCTKSGKTIIFSNDCASSGATTILAYNLYNNNSSDSDLIC